MDFESLIKAALSSGESSESIAAKFTKALNEIEAANKRKEDREYYLEELADSVYSAANQDVVTYEIAAQCAVIAAAGKYPDFTIDDLKELEASFTEALEGATTLYHDLQYGKNDLLSELFKTLDNPRPASSDEEKIKRFIAKL